MATCRHGRGNGTGCCPTSPCSGENRGRPRSNQDEGYRSERRHCGEPNSRRVPMRTTRSKTPAIQTPRDRPSSARNRASCARLASSNILAGPPPGSTFNELRSGADSLVPGCRGRKLLRRLAAPNRVCNSPLERVEKAGRNAALTKSAHSGNDVRTVAGSFQ